MKLKNMSREEFIRQAIEIYGYKYNYSKTIFKDLYTPIIIICPIHGEFIELPSNHLRNYGCKKCKFIDMRAIRKLSTEEFIRRAIDVHGNKYDYSLVNYIDSRTKVIIICPEHGEFYQKPNNHLNGRGCPKCYLQIANTQFRSNTEEFIEKARKIHGDKYDYSKVIYLNCYTKVIIICKKHGEFEQTPSDHLAGKGCSICKSSKGELVIWDVLTKYNIQKERQYCIPKVADELYYDFYLPEYNLLIEFHGIQHYEWIPFFHDNDRGWDLDAQKRRDDNIRHNAFIYKYKYLEFNYKQLIKLTKKEFEKLIIKSINRYKKIY